VTRKISLILANPPFAGSLITRTPPKTCWLSSKPKNELLFLALFLRLLKTRRPGRDYRAGRRVVRLVQCAQAIAAHAVEEQNWTQFISLPSGAFQALCRGVDGYFDLTKTQFGR